MMDNPDKIITIARDSKGTYGCAIPISERQWLDLLHDRETVRAEWLRVLLSFYFMPGHKASCAQCSAEYGHNVNTYNAGITSLGRAVVKKIGGFSIVDESGATRYWPVAVGMGREVRVDGVTQFEWQLRKELVSAIGDYLIENTIDSYADSLDLYWDDEKYKWEAVRWFQQHWNPQAPDFAPMLESALGKTENLLTSRNYLPRQMIVELAQKDPDSVRRMFGNLYDENQDIESRIGDFLNQADALCDRYFPQGTNHYQSTNAVSIYLWLRYPDRYYIYKYSECRSVAEKLGLDYTFKKNGQTSEPIRGYAMYDLLNSHLVRSPRATEPLHALLAADDNLYQDPRLKTATVDLGFYVSRWHESAKDSLYLKTPATMTPFISQASAILRNKKNIILQGAPGTGKTYNTAALALAIIDGSVPESHRDVMARYEQLRAEKRIGFTTFHQSMDYEDFIEGIKPVHDGDSIRYEVHNGIFKRMCEAAKVASEVAASGTDNLLEGMNENPTIWKVSLESTGDNATRRDCMQNGHIRIGWSEYGDIDFTENNPNVTEGRNILRTFQNDMQVGDIVVSCWSANETDAIGIITGDYEYRPEGGNLPRYRDVRWIVKDIRHDIRDINNGKRMTLGTVYRLSISLKDILDVIDTYAPRGRQVLDNTERPYVLIIDEINRGNVSRIFGELITLLEKDKRLGDAHPLTLSLPYSRQPDFGVPQNLYVIGTMNTTDRSTGTIDYAIRRRFAFLTVPAQRHVIQGETGRRLFGDVQRFIERYRYADMDLEDLMVGHSYFMADDDDDLAMKIRHEVIPLVREYIKDGILSVRPDEARRYFDAWQKLQTIDDNDSGTSED